MGKYKNSNFGKDLAEIFGLDISVLKSIVLKVEADEVVTVRVISYVSEEQTKKVTELTQEYELAERRQIKSNGKHQS